MLVSFSIKNYYSIKDKITVSFEANRTKEKDLRFCMLEGKVLSKAIVFIGGNASGKTTVLKGLSFFLSFMFNSFKLADSKQLEIPFEPHFFSKDQPTEFELEFFIEGKLYRYFLHLTKQRVIYETLQLKETVKFSTVYENQWEDADQVYHYKGDRWRFDFKEAEAIKTPENISILSAAGQYGVALAVHLKKFFEYKTNVGLLGKTSYPLAYKIEQAAALFFKDKKLLNDLNHLVGKLDLGLDEVSIEKYQQTGYAEKFFGKSIEHDPIGIHRTNEQEARISFHEESSGTQALFYLLAQILPILNIDNEGPKLMIIDELEADLHPDMLEYIVNLFISPETNPNNVQLIFSSHNPEVLLELDKYQIWLVEKDQSLATDVWRISDIEGVRPDDNIYKKYRAGAYGARPNI